jgi:hypothetical protein
MENEIIVKGKFIKFRWSKPTKPFRNKKKYNRKPKHKSNEETQ